jgi:hypothetical protein
MAQPTSAPASMSGTGTAHVLPTALKRTIECFAFTAVLFCCAAAGSLLRLKPHLLPRERVVLALR